MWRPEFTPFSFLWIFPFFEMVNVFFVHNYLVFFPDNVLSLLRPIQMTYLMKINIQILEDSWPSTEGHPRIHIYAQRWHTIHDTRIVQWQLQRWKHTNYRSGSKKSHQSPLFLVFITRPKFTIKYWGKTAVNSQWSPYKYSDF